MTRPPLATLPLARFVPPSNTLPSPISLPSKRSLNSTSTSVSTPVVGSACSSASSTKGLGRISGTQLHSSSQTIITSPFKSSKRRSLDPPNSFIESDGTLSTSHTSTETQVATGSKRKIRRLISEQEGKVTEEHEPHHHSDRSSDTHVITPKARAVLDRDDLGLGRSPARRLFKDATTDKDVSPSKTTSPSRLAPSPPIHTRRRVVTRSASSAAAAAAAAQSKSNTTTTAKSIPMSSSKYPTTTPKTRSSGLSDPSTSSDSSVSSSSQPATWVSQSAQVSIDENGAERNVHDIGFVIYNQYEHDVSIPSGDSAQSSTSSVGVGTPESKPRSRGVRSTNATTSAPIPPPSPDGGPNSSLSSSSSSTSWVPDNEQENIPPTPASSARTTPHRSGQGLNGALTASSGTSCNSGGSGGSSRTMTDADLVVLASGTNRRRIQRSKLATDIASASAGSEGSEEVEAEGDELTPGRKVVKGDKDQVKREIERF